MSDLICEFRTSLGYAEISFDLTTFKPQLVRGRWLNRKIVDCTNDFRWIKGYEFIKKLYDFSDDGVFIISKSDGSLWLKIELRDSYHGIPEYLLDFVSYFL
jgi:hypothetical protein